MDRPNLILIVPACALLVAAGVLIGAGITLAVQHRRRPRRWLS